MIENAKQIYKDWYFTEKTARVPKTQIEMCAKIKVSRQAAILWQKEFDRKDSHYRPKTDVEELEEKLFGLAKDGRNPKYAELWLKMKGELNNSGGEKIEFSVADKQRIAIEVIRGLREMLERDGGVCPVCSERKILRKTVCVGTEPEHAENREVETLGVSA